MAHLLGYRSVDGTALPHDLMTTSLSPGVRRFDLAGPAVTKSVTVALAADSQPEAALAAAFSDMAAMPAAPLEPGWLLERRGSALFDNLVWEPTTLLPADDYQPPPRTRFVSVGKLLP